MKNIDLNDMKELKVVVSHLMNNPEILKECKKETQESLNIVLHAAGMDAICGKTIDNSNYIVKGVAISYIDSLVYAISLYMEDGNDIRFTNNHALFPHADEVYNSLEEKNEEIKCIIDKSRKSEPGDIEDLDFQTSVIKPVKFTSELMNVCSGSSQFDYLKTLIPRLMNSSIETVEEFMGYKFSKEIFDTNKPMLERILLSRLYDILILTTHIKPRTLKSLKDINIPDVSKEIKEGEPSKKYKLETNSFVNNDGTTIYRIRALKSFGNVQKGDLGGFIEKEDNLSQEGNCWVYGDAKVYGNAIVCDDAIVKDYATVSGSAYIRNKACVFSFAKVYDNADVCDKAMVGGSCLVHGDTMVRDKAAIIDNSELCNNGVLKDDVIIRGNSLIESINDYVTIPTKDDDGNISTLTFSKTRVGTLLVYTEMIPPMNLGDFALRLSNNGNKVKEYILSCRKAVELAKIVLLP